jgi:hypothetical protein
MKYIVSYACNGLYGIAPSKHATKRDAMKSAREYIRAWFTKGKGERVERMENGYCLSHVAGGTLAIATVETIYPL